MTYRVLVVEDDTDISLAIELNLRLDGFQVELRMTDVERSIRFWSLIRIV